MKLLSYRGYPLISFSSGNLKFTEIIQQMNEYPVSFRFLFLFSTIPNL